MSKLQSDRPPLILIVDDDRTMRSLLNLAMEEEGYQVVEAANGEQCLTEYSHFQPDLILLDAVMPDINGFTCCQKIRRLSQGDKPNGIAPQRLPILMITVLDDQESVEQAFSAGATDYITKPIHWSVLSQRVRRLLAVAKLETELSQQQSWERLISKILTQLVARDSLKILDNIRYFSAANRVLLYQSDSSTYLESIPASSLSIQDFSSTDFNLITIYGEQYQQGKPIVIKDVSQADLLPVMKEQLKQLNIQSLAIAPLKTGDRLLGLLAMHFTGLFPQDRLSPNRLLDLANLLTTTINY